MKKTENNPTKNDGSLADNENKERLFLNAQKNEAELPLSPKKEEIRSDTADMKNNKNSDAVPLKEPDQNDPNERQGYKNRDEKNAVEHRLTRTKSGFPDKSYRTHIERNNNQTGIPKKDNPI